MKSLEELTSDRALKCINACAGVTDEMLDGGWAAKELSQYAKSLELDADRYRYLREKPDMLLHLSKNDFDAEIDKRMHRDSWRGKK